jgi:DNA-binding NtrC family response regulator/tetratricopeptide (TPR) repeat protein
MEFLEDVNRLKQAGRFSDALVALGRFTPTQGLARPAEVLRIELLEAIGQHRDATALAGSLLRVRQLQPTERSACEYILGKILVDEGNAVTGMDHLQRSASYAREAGAFDRLFSAQLKLLAVVSERSGPGAAAALLADVRQLATKLGDPHVTARLHLYIAETEAKRGLLDNARRHSAIARRILSGCPNSFLEAFCSNLDLAISVLLCQFESAKVFGGEATGSAQRSGAAKIMRAVLNNLASLYCEIGQFDLANRCFQDALAVSEINGTHSSAIFDGMARIRLLEGRLDECAELLDRVECSIQSEDDRTLYGYRYAALTRAQLLASQGRNDEALAKITSVSTLATQTGDALLLSKAELTRAALLLRVGRISESLGALEAVGPELVGESPEIYAHTEQVLACALVMERRAVRGQVHHDRALRIYRSISNVTGELELQRSWAESIAAVDRQSVGVHRTEIAPSDENGSQVLHGIATAVAHGRHPDLIARELVDILSITGCVQSVRAVSRTSAEIEKTLSSAVDGIGQSAHGPEQRLAVGFENGQTIDLVFEPKTDTESVASLKAVRILLSCIQELKRARVEREQEATLWPLEDLHGERDRAVITGRMGELINYARRIARTKVNVLITGESGTGKEILARAIHDFSDRATKAFVPFNCTAIPRDLLESQLFGHRRGAFTGADRDQLGLIRAAREGTLFLDEVGELGLDLQPKLLRFLESGEISPLGEPGSLTIDVRIVAATNANLEDAVRAGRFREDLFYRLNVVRLSIPPLRERRDEIPGFVNHFVTRAAEEFKKGQLRVAEETMERLLLYRWPGNVRQLQNEMRRMVALAEPDSTLLPHAISDDILGALPIFRHPAAGDAELTVDLHDKLMPTIARIEAEMIKAALKKHGGKVEDAATALGISRKGLYLKRQRLGL